MYSLKLHGRRLLKLHKCRSLRYSVNPFQKESAFFSFFSSSAFATDVSSQDARKGQNFTVSYLVDSLGLTKKLAESISRKVSFEDKCSPDSVLSLFRSHGFTDSQISAIITDYPLLLTVDAEKSLGPKLQVLQSRGASSSVFTETISKVPKILGKERSIRVYYDFVKEVMEADKSSEFKKLCHSSLPQGKQENKIRNISALRDLGVPQQLLFPLLISKSPHICGKEKFEESLKKVIEMGFAPTIPRFLDALRIVMTLNNETIEGKISVYKSLGFALEDIWAMFKKFPNFLALSEKKITQNFETMKKCGLLEDELRLVVKKFPQCIGVSEQNILNSIETFAGLGFSRDDIAMMVKRLPACIGYSPETVKQKTEFVVKEMNWPLKALVSYPQVLGYSLEKRMVPRCDVIRVLISKGLIKSEVPSVSSVLVCSDQVFLKRYVRKHNHKQLVTTLMAILTGEKKNKQIMPLNVEGFRSL